MDKFLDLKILLQGEMNTDIIHIALREHQQKVWY